MDWMENRKKMENGVIKEMEKSVDSVLVCACVRRAELTSRGFLSDHSQHSTRYCVQINNALPSKPRVSLFVFFLLLLFIMCTFVSGLNVYFGLQNALLMRIIKKNPRSIKEQEAWWKITRQIIFELKRERAFCSIKLRIKIRG